MWLFYLFIYLGFVRFFFWMIYLSYLPIRSDPVLWPFRLFEEVSYPLIIFLCFILCFSPSYTSGKSFVPYNYLLFVYFSTSVLVITSTPFSLIFVVIVCMGDLSDFNISDCCYLHRLMDLIDIEIMKQWPLHFIMKTKPLSSPLNKT